MDDAREALWTRRHVLRTAALAAAVAPAAWAIARRGGIAATPQREIYLTANDDLDGRHWISAIDARGDRRWSLPVEMRCHAIAFHPTDAGRAIVVARRPGTVMYDVDVAAGAFHRVVRSAPDRHFYGHACWSRDGSVLFTSENDRERGIGVIAVRDGRDLSVLGEIASGGVGPHELVLLADRRTLAVANGGIATDLDSGAGRRKMNVPDMDPSLAYVDVHSGRIIEQVRPSDHFSSVRHLSYAPSGVGAIAMQYEGPDDAVREMVAFHAPGGGWRDAATPADVLVRMKRYVASVCVSGEHGVAAATCPRGGLVAFYDVASGELRRTIDLVDVAGIALSGEGDRFVATSGIGDVVQVDARTLEPIAAPVRVAGARWDNHLGRPALGARAA